MSVKVELDSRLPDIMARLPGVIEKWVQRQVAKMEGRARAYAPVDTGLLRNSSKQYIRNKGSSVEGEVMFNAYYAAYVNFGTGQRGAASNVPERPSEVRYGSSVGRVAKPYLSLAAYEVAEELADAVRQLEREIGP